MMISTPWVTQTLNGEDYSNGDFSPTGGERFVLYAMVQLAATVLFFSMVQRIVATKLFRPDTPSDLANRTRWRNASFALAFGLSIALFFVTVYAWSLWLVVLLSVGITHAYCSARAVRARLRPFGSVPFRSVPFRSDRLTPCPNCPDQMI